MVDTLLGGLGLYGGTLIVCVIAGLVPIVNAELFLISLSTWAVDSPEQLPVIVALAAIGQMIAKVGLYYAGLGMFELPRGRWRERIENARARLERWKRQPYIIYAASTVFGLPPLYLTTLAAGALKINLMLFVVIGLVGRSIRFAVVVALPWL